MAPRAKRYRVFLVAGATLALLIILLLVRRIPSSLLADYGRSADNRPNIVLIVADDLGLETLSAYGGTSYQTPHIDALAAQGTVFKYAFATPLCTPSRAELITGMYPFRTGWTNNIWQMPQGHRTLDRNLPSLARVLRDAGYSTVVAGKWHLSLPASAPDHPSEMGFGEHIVWSYVWDGRLQPRYWRPSIVENGKLNASYQEDNVYGPDVFADYLVDFIERKRDEPFFVYYPMCLPHQPFLPTPDTVTEVRAAMGVGPDPSESNVEHFGSMMSYMDKMIGAIIQSLDRLGLREKTLIIFTADNGTDRSVVSRQNERTVRGGKTILSERGAAVPLIVNWPATTPAGGVNRDLVDFSDLLPTLADIAEAPLPEEPQVDGVSFAAQIMGVEPLRRRDWVYVEQGGRYFLRTRSYALFDDGSFHSVQRRFRPKLIPRGSESEEQKAAREQVQRWLTDLQRRPGSERDYDSDR